MSTADRLLATFRATAGAARANRYRVSFDRGQGDRLDILCDSVTWPGRQIMTTEYYTDMKAIKKPYAFANEDINISFILTNNWYAWEYLKSWQSSTINQIDTVTNALTVNLRQDYVRQVIIEHLDEQDRPRKIVQLINAYPTTLASMELGNANENTIIRCTATLSYDNWKSFDTQDTNNITSTTTGLRILSNLLG